MWQYLYFMVYLNHKPEDEHTGQESYVHAKLQAADVTFFPLMKSMELEGHLGPPSATPAPPSPPGAHSPASGTFERRKTLVGRGVSGPDTEFVREEMMSSMALEPAEFHGVTDQLLTHIQRLDHSVETLSEQMASKIEGLDHSVAAVEQTTGQQVRRPGAVRWCSVFVLCRCCTTDTPSTAVGHRQAPVLKNLWRSPAGGFRRLSGRATQSLLRFSRQQPSLEHRPAAKAAVQSVSCALRFPA